MTDSLVEGDEGLPDVLEDHPIEHLLREVEPGPRRTDGPLHFRKDRLVVLPVVRGGFRLHPLGYVRHALLEQGVPELLFVTVEIELQPQELRIHTGLVANRGFQGRIQSEAEFGTFVDLPVLSSVNDGEGVPDPVISAEFAKEDDSDAKVGSDLQYGGYHLRVVQNKQVPFPEIVEDVLEKPVFDLPAIPVQNHQARLVPPHGGGRSNLFEGEIKIERILILLGLLLHIVES